MKIGFVIPCYKSANAVLSVISSVKADFPSALIITVVDGEPQNIYSDLLKLSAADNSLQVVFRPENGGVGAATMSGLDLAFSEYGCDVAIKVDSDDQMVINEANNLLAALPSDRDDIALVKGERISRIVNFPKFKPRRLLGNIIINLFSLLCTGRRSVLDPTCGYLCITRELWDNLSAERSHINVDYRFESSLILSCLSAGFEIKSVYVTPKYDNHLSSMSDFMAGRQILFLFLKFYFKRIIREYFMTTNLGTLYLLSFLAFFVMGSFLTIIYISIGIYTGLYISSGYIALWLLIMFSCLGSALKFLEFDLSNRD